MLEALFSEMPGIRLDDITIFIATGTHRRNSDEEIERMIGREFARSCRVICHDARDTASLVHVGDTGGVRVHLNREWVASDFKITTDRKSTRLNSSHLGISYAVFCLKKK